MSQFATRPLALCRLALLLMVLLLAGAALAAPHAGDRFLLAQPDGSRVEVAVWGDEFYQRVESPDGYTLIRDPGTRVICYADLSADGRSFVSTGVRVGEPVPSGLPRGLTLPVAERAARAREARERFLVEERAMLAAKSGDPQPSSLGDVRGLTLIIDFSDQPGTIPAADFDAYLNQPGYTGYGNNGSVRDYFFDVSGGALEYTNWVPAAYIRAPQPKSYYEDPEVQNGLRARELVAWALNELDDDGFDFSQYDANDDGYIDAVNVFYAGYPDGGWAVGLWPHSWVVNFAADGVQSYKYQITNIGDSLRLSTFCHENGHLIMFWPDLYDYGYESNGVGGFCLMCNSGPGTNPVQPCAYLRADAGWEQPVALQGLQPDLPATAAGMEIYKVPRTGHPNEYYLIENRFRGGRDSGLPDSGLAVWHVDEYGSNDNEQQTPASHYLVTLVQADGRWDLENDVNQGDAGDLWKAPDYVEFNPATVPSARWWDGSDAPLYLDGISAPGAEMSFNYREDVGTMGVTITPLPIELEAPWVLTGPEGYEESGQGERSLLLWAEGQYTLVWGDVPGWSEPVPGSEVFDIVDGAAPVQISGTYADPPFALVDAGVAADAGAAAAVVLRDLDGDGDLDLHLVNHGSADRVFGNEGGLVFSDITPAGLDDAGPGRAAAWGDYDNDGDADCYLVRDGAPNLMLEQDGGVFTDVAGLSTGLADAGPGASASWSDVDGDGQLDLYLVQDGDINRLFRNYGDVGSGHPLLLNATHPALQDAGAGRVAVWRDYDRDGDRDVYVVNDGTANALVRSYQGTMFEHSGDAAVASTAAGQDAAWGDFDNDGDWDLYLANAGAADAYYRRESTFFQPVHAPVLQDAGAAAAVAAADLDNDGALDLYVARDGQDDLLLFGDGAGGFTRSLLALPETAGPSVALACADLDGDGGVDLYVARDGAPNLILRNQIQGRGHWLGVDLTGDPANRDAIGAVVRVVAGGITRIREIDGGGGRADLSLRAHFGLGTAAVADTVTVTWPGSGEQTVQTGVAADQVLTILQTPAATAVDDRLPLATRLQAPHPNPFNPTTTIAFELAQAGSVRLSVYGVDGRHVADLVDESLAAGAHRAVWRGRDGAGRPVASGTYLVQLRTAAGTFSQRLTLIK